MSTYRSMHFEPKAMDRTCPDVQGVLQEHGALLRQLAELQQRVSQQSQAHVLQLAAANSEVLRLRAQLVIARTCLLWDLPREGLARVRPLRNQTPSPAAEACLAQASAVICQTGCVGHAHPWLEADGQCRRTGMACGPLEGATAAERGDRSPPSTHSGRAAPDLPMVVNLKRRGA